MESVVRKYFELFGEFPFEPIASNISEKQFNERVKRCVEQEKPLNELYPDDYNEPDGVII